MCERKLILLCAAGILWVGVGLPAHAEDATTFDHSLFDKVLSGAVRDGEVDYGMMAQKYQDLQTYLSQLASAPFRSLPREEQIAMAINAYNANCINGVLKGKKIQSVKDVWFFFKNAKFQLGGEEMSLDSLENDVLRKMGEPRIHFALVRAAKGSPILAAHAYCGASLNNDLDQAMRDFIQNSTYNRLDTEKKILYLSPIFKWYKKDFTSRVPSVSAYVRPYLSEADQAVMKDRAVKVKFLDFDWNLNGHY